MEFPYDQFMLGNEYVKELRMNHPWVDRAISNPLRYNENESVRTAVEYDEEHGWIVFPTIRMNQDTNQLEKHELNDAWNIARKNKDFIPIPSLEAGQYVSHGLSNWLGKHGESK